MFGVSNLDGEIYFNGGGPNIVGDPSSGEVGPDSIMWICSQTKLITSVNLSLTMCSLSVSWTDSLVAFSFSVGCLKISRTRQNHF